MSAILHTSGDLKDALVGMSEKTGVVIALTSGSTGQYSMGFLTYFRRRRTWSRIGEPSYPKASRN